MLKVEPSSNDLISRAKEFFSEKIVPAHLDSALKRASKLSNYNVNPFIIKYLANFLEGDGSPKSIAKALIYPRILGTSMTTIFGNFAQAMMSQIFQGFGSAVSGIDIEFIDAIDGRKKYCQLKSGPNTINKDDVATIIGHFKGVRNLARTNKLKIEQNDLIVGVIYGTESDLSGHYKVIAKEIPVYIGADLWYRITGEKDFYFQLIDALAEVALDIDGRERLELAIETLAKEVEVVL